MRVKKGEIGGTKDLECLNLEGTFVFSLFWGNEAFILLFIRFAFSF